MEKIRIFHSADAHGDLEAIKIYSDHIKEQKPDIAFLTGDLIDGVFPTEQLKEYVPIIREYEKKKYALLKSAVEGLNIVGPEEMMKLFPQELFQAIKNGTLEDDALIEIPGKIRGAPSTKDLNDLLNNPAVLPSVGAAIEPYLKARETYKEPYKLAKQSMESQYKEIAKILEGLPCLVLPGNHDGKCLEEIMGNRNLHKDGIIFKGIKIAGYGSAKGVPQGMPPELLENFPMFKDTITKEDEKIEYEGSEAGAFMIYKDPDIAVLHETPFADEGIKAYITTEQPYLILTGHLHDLIGATYEFGKNTCLIMPGKLGIDEKTPLRTFVEIELQKEEGKSYIESVDFSYKQIKDDKIEPYTG